MAGTYDDYKNQLWEEESQRNEAAEARSQQQEEK